MHATIEIKAPTEENDVERQNELLKEASAGTEVLRSGCAGRAGAVRLYQPLLPHFAVAGCLQRGAGRRLSPAAGAVLRGAGRSAPQPEQGRSGAAVSGAAGSCRGTAGADEAYAGRRRPWLHRHSAGT